MRSVPGRRWSIVVLGLAVAAAALGCQRIQARAELKQGNSLYAGGSYREALASFQKGLALDPSATFAWRSVGFSAMALHRPGDHGPDNEELADLAVEAFETYLEAHPGDRRIEEYLLTVLLNAERYDEAIARLEEQARTAPGPATRRAIANVLIRAGRLEDALAKAEAPGAEPDPEIFYSIGVAAWDRAANDPRIDSAAAEQIVDLGLEATARAIELRPDYAQAMAYHNLLLRQKARLEPDPWVQQEWIAQAEEWRDKAIALKAAAAEPGGRPPAEPR